MKVLLVCSGRRPRPPGLIINVCVFKTIPAQLKQERCSFWVEARRKNQSTGSSAGSRQRGWMGLSVKHAERTQAHRWFQPPSPLPFHPSPPPLRPKYHLRAFTCTHTHTSSPRRRSSAGPPSPKDALSVVVRDLQPHVGPGANIKVKDDSLKAAEAHGCGQQACFHWNFPAFSRPLTPLMKTGWGLSRV